MESQLNKKNERIEIRVSAQDKELFRMAQELSGVKSFSGFIIEAAKARAEEIVTKNQQIIVSERDRKKFFDAVFGDKKPNRTLIDAAERYKSTSS
ncbi:MAG: DUF1778 domain-containing protein [Bacteroidales bacterium]